MTEDDLEKLRRDRLKAGLCPECGCKLVHTGGCKLCVTPGCGFEVCGG